MRQMILGLLMLIGWSVASLAQDSDSVDIRLQQLIKKMTGERYRPFSILQELGINGYPPTLLEKVKAYQQFPNPDVQEKIYEVYYEYAVHSTDQPFRQQMVNKLLESCTDSVKTSYACLYISDLLKLLNKDDFDTTARKKISGILSNARYGAGYTRLAGFLALKEAIPYIERIAKNAEDPTESFDAKLSLARMQQAPYAKRVTDSLARVHGPLDLFRDHYEDLLYLKIPEVLPLLERVLNSNEREPPLEPGEEGMKIALRAMNILALNLQNFPVAYQSGGITSEEDLKKGRAWLKLNKNKARFNTSKY